MTTTDFTTHVAAEIARLETEIGHRTRDIDRLASERDGLSRLLSHLYPLRAAYEDAAPAALAEPVEELVARVVEEAEEPEPSDGLVGSAVFEADVREAMGETLETFPAAVAELVDAVAERALVVETGSLSPAPAAPQDGTPASRTQGLERDREERAPSAGCANAGAEGAAPEELAPASQPVRALTALGAAWTEEDERTLLALRDEGLTSPDIAARMGRTTKAVESRLLKLRNGGKKIAHKGPGVPVPTERVAKMRRMREDGATYAKIGEAFGVTGEAVRQLLAKAPAEEAKPEPVAAEPEEALPEPAHAAPEPPSLPAVRRPATAPAPRPVAVVTEAITELRRADRPLLGDTPVEKAPPAKPGTSDLRRRIAAHLDLIGHDGGWSPRRDLDLFEGVIAANLADTARRLNVTQEVAAARFKGLCQPIRDPRTGNSVEGQKVLHEVLRERVALQLEAAE